MAFGARGGFDRLTQRERAKRVQGQCFSVTTC